MKPEQVGEYIKTYIEVYGKSPTYREIGQAFGVSSKGTISHHVEALERSGFLTRTGGYKRVIRVHGSN